jgi:mannosyltransferase OCH1-like enzyme
MIPKIIHYCWLSGDPVPKDYQKRMRSWDKKLSGYEFMLWDTKRFDINRTDWTKKAFAAKNYAFTADYIRLYAVYHFGGIYLDMDVEVVKSFDDFLNAGIFLAKECQAHDSLEAGCFGAEKGHPFIKKCLDWFDSHTFGDPQHILVPFVMYNVHKAYFNTIPIYSHDYFTAKNPVTGKIVKTSNTYAIHHFASNWVSKPDRIQRGFEQIIYRMFGEHTKVSSLLFELVKKIRTVWCRLRKDNLFAAMKHYFKKYVLSKRGNAP